MSGWKHLHPTSKAESKKIAAPGPEHGLRINQFLARGQKYKRVLLDVKVAEVAVVHKQLLPSVIVAVVARSLILSDSIVVAA